MKRNEPISHIMKTNPITVHTGETLSDARRKMMEGGFHHLPVVTGNKLVGMLSATDILRVSYQYDVDDRLADTVLDHTRSITDVMHPGAMKLQKSATVREAAEVFAKGWFHGLPVCDGDELVGIVTTTDMINYLLDQY